MIIIANFPIDKRPIRIKISMSDEQLAANNKAWKTKRKEPKTAIIHDDN